MSGDLLEGKYKIIKILGHGGMGTVYLVQNIRLDTLWAIKELKKQNGRKFDLLAEPNILKRLSHPALPRIFDIFEDHENLYVVVDYIEGESLEKILSRLGRICEETVIGWAVQLCKVLDYLHNFKPNPIIYRDMKPSNIMVTTDGAIKLIDFGIAREYKDESESDTVYIGTRGYAAPEQYGSGQTNASTDIYSLGVTLHHLLTGRSPNEPPFEIMPIRQYVPEVSKELEQIIARCTRLNPSERYQSARQLLDDLEAIGKKAETLAEKDIKPEHVKAKSDKRSFKKLVLTVWDSPEFGCELAYMAAKWSEYSVLLVDLDLLSPKADLYLNVDKQPHNIVGEGLSGKSGLEIVLEASDKNCLDRELMSGAAIRRNELANLHILTGSYKIDNYEYYSDSSLINLIDKAYMYFDLTILLVNKSIYDSFTVLSLIRSDYNIVAQRADLDILREFNSYIVFLKSKQQIPEDKTKFVAFEYKASVNLSRAMIEEITEHNYLGQVGYSEKRCKYRNLRVSYARRMEKSVTNDYLRLLAQFHILPVKSLIRRIGEGLGEFWIEIRRHFRSILPKKRTKNRLPGGV